MLKHIAKYKNKNTFSNETPSKKLQNTSHVLTIQEVVDKESNIDDVFFENEESSGSTDSDNESDFPVDIKYGKHKHLRKRKRRINDMTSNDNNVFVDNKQLPLMKTVGRENTTSLGSKIDFQHGVSILLKKKRRRASLMTADEYEYVRILKHIVEEELKRYQQNINSEIEIDPEYIYRCVVNGMEIEIPAEEMKAFHHALKNIDIQQIEPVSDRRTETPIERKKIVQDVYGAHKHENNNKNADPLKKTYSTNQNKAERNTSRHSSNVRDIEVNEALIKGNTQTNAQKDESRKVIKPVITFSSLLRSTASSNTSGESMAFPQMEKVNTEDYDVLGKNIDIKEDLNVITSEITCKKNTMRKEIELKNAPNNNAVESKSSRPFEELSNTKGSRSIDLNKSTKEDNLLKSDDGIQTENNTRKNKTEKNNIELDQIRRSAVKEIIREDIPLNENTSPPIIFSSKQLFDARTLPVFSENPSSIPNAFVESFFNSFDVDQYSPSNPLDSNNSHKENAGQEKDKMLTTPLVDLNIHSNQCSNGDLHTNTPLKHDSKPKTTTNPDQIPRIPVDSQASSGMKPIVSSLLLHSMPIRSQQVNLEGFDNSTITYENSKITAKRLLKDSIENQVNSSSNSSQHSLSKEADTYKSSNSVIHNNSDCYTHQRTTCSSFNDETRFLYDINTISNNKKEEQRVQRVLQNSSASQKCIEDEDIKRIVMERRFKRTDEILKNEMKQQRSYGVAQVSDICKTEKRRSVTLPIKLDADFSPLQKLENDFFSILDKHNTIVNVKGEQQQKQYRDIKDGVKRINKSRALSMPLIPTNKIDVVTLTQLKSFKTDQLITKNSSEESSRKQVKEDIVKPLRDRNPITGKDAAGTSINEGIDWSMVLKYSAANPSNTHEAIPEYLQQDEQKHNPFENLKGLSNSVENRAIIARLQKLLFNIDYSIVEHGGSLVNTAHTSLHKKEQGATDLEDSVKLLLSEIEDAIGETEATQQVCHKDYLLTTGLENFQSRDKGAITKEKTLHVKNDVIDTFTAKNKSTDPEAIFELEEKESDTNPGFSGFLIEEDSKGIEYESFSPYTLIKDRKYVNKKSISQEVCNDVVDINSFCVIELADAEKECPLSFQKVRKISQSKIIMKTSTKGYIEIPDKTLLEKSYQSLRDMIPLQNENLIAEDTEPENEDDSDENNKTLSLTSPLIIEVPFLIELEKSNPDVTSDVSCIGCSQNIYKTTDQQHSNLPTRLLTLSRREKEIAAKVNVNTLNKPELLEDSNSDGTTEEYEDTHKDGEKKSPESVVKIALQSIIDTFCHHDNKLTSRFDNTNTMVFDLNANLDEDINQINNYPQECQLGSYKDKAKEGKPDVKDLMQLEKDDINSFTIDKGTNSFNNNVIVKQEQKQNISTQEISTKSQFLTEYVKHSGSINTGDSKNISYQSLDQSKNNIDDGVLLLKQVEILSTPSNSEDFLEENTVTTETKINKATHNKPETRLLTAGSLTCSELGKITTEHKSTGYNPHIENEDRPNSCNYHQKVKDIENSEKANKNSFTKSNKDINGNRTKVHCSESYLENQSLLLEQKLDEYNLSSPRTGIAPSVGLNKKEGKVFKINSITKQSGKKLDLYSYLEENQKSVFSLSEIILSDENKRNMNDAVFSLAPISLDSNPSQSTEAIEIHGTVVTSEEIVCTSDTTNKDIISNNVLAIIHDVDNSDINATALNELSESQNVGRLDADHVRQRSKSESSELKVVLTRGEISKRRTISFLFPADNGSTRYETNLEIPCSNNSKNLRKHVSMLSVADLEHSKLQSESPPHFLSVGNMPEPKEFCKKSSSPQQWQYSVNPCKQGNCQMSIQVILDPNVLERVETETFEYQYLLKETETDGSVGEWVLVNCTRNEIQIFIELLRELLKQEKAKNPNYQKAKFCKIL